MEEDLDLELDNIQTNTEQNAKVKNRFQQLSEKVINTSKERDDALAKGNTEAEARVKAEKERDFFKGFSANITKYPEAANHQDKILELVNKGYDPEDAMVSVLAKEGKFAPAEIKREIQAEGGSAPTTMEGTKEFRDMKPDEKLDRLKELDKSGDLANVILGR